MKWLLLIRLLGPSYHEEPKQTEFHTKQECVAVARAFVKRYPEFELRIRPSKKMEPAVEVPAVECVPDTSDIGSPPR
jgi:hypothetical protein